MAAQAYFMVAVAEKYLKNGGYVTILKDLQDISEVKSVERVVGTHDLVMKVEVPVSGWTIFAANKVLAKQWVKRLRVLYVEPLEVSANLTLSRRE